jgi:hypothetical protein
VHVLHNMVEAVKPGGLLLDLQVIRPNPTVEVDGKHVCEIDGEPLFRKADAATAAVDALVAFKRLIEQAIDDHDVRKHYSSGPELIDDFANKERSLPASALADLRSLEQPCAVRERCRLRRLALQSFSASQRPSAW